MFRRLLAGLALAVLTSSTLLCALSIGSAGMQDQPKGKIPATTTNQEKTGTAATPVSDAPADPHAQITKMINAYDLNPHPAPSIPDNPPPHEGAMIGLRHVVEPPDLLIIEVLEALPGRPISGERMVRPDGKISLGFYGEISVRGMTLDQVKVAIIKRLRNSLLDENLGLLEDDTDVAGEGRWQIVPPAESDKVFVDVTAYNSKNYYVEGDVLIPGKLPWTRNETVLDVIEFAGGLLPSADPTNIRLVRPGLPGRPAKVYKVDRAAIRDDGDVRANYQIFPNDRLIIGRDEVVKKTVEIDRLNAPIQSIASTILTQEFMLRYLQFVTRDNREQLLQEFVDFWSKELSRPGGIKFDDQTLRDALIRKMKLTPPPPETRGRDGK